MFDTARMSSLSDICCTSASAQINRSERWSMWNEGRALTFTKDNKWYLWSGTGWNQVTAPTATP
jgi:hypothetical protein